jgi:hypothetical protein
LAWFGLFGLAIFLDDQAMAWVVASSAGMPVWLVAVAGWGPYGLTFLLLGLGNVLWPGNPVRGAVGGSLALCGLAVAVQTPVAFNRHSSDFYDALAGTPQGRAFIAGAMWASLPVLAGFLVFLAVRWVLNRRGGGRKPFFDGSWASSTLMRPVGVTAMAIVVCSLLAAVVTAV